MILRVDRRGNVTLRTPLHTTKHQARAFVDAELAWIQAQLAKVPPPPDLVAGTRLPHPQGMLTLRLYPATPGPVRRIGHELWLPGGATLPEETKRSRLESWLRKEARHHALVLLAHWSQRIGVTPKRLTIRDQQSRWGSCSRAGGINLNWRILWLPTELANFLVIHELCHLHHMHHGPEFWALVATHDPNWREHRRQLKRSAFPW